MTADSSHRPSNQPEFKPDLGETAVPTASEAAAAPPRAQPPSQAYWYLVCVLLLVIIGCLAYLWSSEHNSRVAAQNDLKALSDRDRQQNEAVQAFLSRINGAVAPLQADERSSHTVTIEGRSRQAVVISDDTARRLGFAPGEVILAGSGNSPATAPASSVQR